MDDVFTLRPGEQLQAAERAIAALIAAGETLAPDFRDRALTHFPDWPDTVPHRIRGAAEGYLFDQAEDGV